MKTGESSVRAFSFSSQGKSFLSEDSAQYLLRQMRNHDYYTYHHSLRVANLAKSFTQVLHLTEYEQELVKTIGLFHDVGKLKIPTSIIQKRDKLTDEEYQILKLHPLHGVNLLRNLDPNVHVGLLDGILYHHENVNGTGYLYKKKGSQIPYYARIMRIVDSFDAMTSRRPYRKPLSVKEALEVLEKEAGEMFDSSLTKLFCRSIEMKKISLLNG